MKQIEKINMKIMLIRLIGFFVGVFLWASFVYQNYVACEELGELSRQDWAVQTIVITLLVIPLFSATKFLRNKFLWPILFSILCAGTLYWIYDRSFFIINMCSRCAIPQLIKIISMNILITVVLGFQVYAFIRIDRVVAQPLGDSPSP